jgi:hypothetical protein
LSVPVRSNQTPNVPDHVRKIVQVNPTHTPSDQEYRADPTFGSITSAFPLPNQAAYSAYEATRANEKSESRVAQNAIARAANFKNCNKVRHRALQFGFGRLSETASEHASS